MNPTADVQVDRQEGLAQPSTSNPSPRRAAASTPGIAAAALAASLASIAILSQRQASAPLATEQPSPLAAMPVPATGPSSAADVLIPLDFGAPQHEDGMVPLSLLGAAAAVNVSSSSARAAEPFVSRLPAYFGPTLANEIRKAALTGMKLWTITPFGRALTADAAEADEPVQAAGSAVGAAILERQQGNLARHDVNEAIAADWKKMSKAEQEKWAETWEQGAKATAQQHAATKGKALLKAETVCVGHTDKCTFGEMRLTYADGTQETIKYDPLVFDLAGNGFRVSGKTLEIDINGDGRLEPVADLAPGLGLLVFDANKDGVSGGRAAELFSAATDLDRDGKPDGFADGFDAFNGLVRMAVRDGALPKEVLVSMKLGPAELEALRKGYGLKFRIGGFRGEEKSLAEAGIREVGLSAQRSVRQNAFDGRGTDIVRRPGAVFARADGSLGDYADLWLGRRRLALMASAR